MATVSCFKVHYHAIQANGRPDPQFGFRTEHVASATATPAAIQTILNNNGKGAPSGTTLVFDEISNSGAGTYLS